MMFCAIGAPGERVQKVKEVQSLQDEPDSEWEGELADRTCIYPLGTHSGEKERMQLRRHCLGDG